MSGDENIGKTAYMSLRERIEKLEQFIEQEFKVKSGDIEVWRSLETYDTYYKNLCKEISELKKFIDLMFDVSNTDDKRIDNLESVLKELIKKFSLYHDDSIHRDFFQDLLAKLSGEKETDRGRFDSFRRKRLVGTPPKCTSDSKPESIPKRYCGSCDYKFREDGLDGFIHCDYLYEPNKLCPYQKKELEKLSGEKEDWTQEQSKSRSRLSLSREVKSAESASDSKPESNCESIDDELPSPYREIAELRKSAPQDDYDPDETPLYTTHHKEEIKELIQEFLRDWRWGKALEIHQTIVGLGKRCFCPFIYNYWKWFEEKWEARLKNDTPKSP